MCVICTNRYNIKKRKVITCKLCGEACCKYCIEEYLFRSFTDVHCMFCKKLWDYRFIYENLDKSFLRKLKREQSKLLLDTEKSLLPETQKYIEYEKMVCAMEEEINTSHMETTKLSDSIAKIESEIPLKCCPNVVCSAKYVFHKDKYCYKCKQNICILCRSIYHDRHHVCDEGRRAKVALYLESIKRKIDMFHKTETMKYKVYKWRTSYTIDKEVVPYEHRVICVCPKNNCKGYITSKAHRCNLCNICICKRCYGEFSEGHECNADNIKTVEMIKTTTKPCPKCASLIHKIDGCDQMWCTNCNTAFGWTTGKIDKGAVHNPHYFEWFNSMDRNADPTAPNHNTRNCEGIPEQRYFLTHLALTVKRKDLRAYNVMLLYYRLMLHINDVFLTDNDNREQEDKVKQNLDLRMQWVLDKIDESKWSMILYQRNKQENINRAKREIFAMFVTVSSDICHKILACNDHIPLRQYICEWDSLINYTNTCFGRLRHVFNLQMPFIKIDDSFEFTIKSRWNY